MASLSLQMVEILLCFQDNNTGKTPARTLGKTENISVSGSLDEQNFKMAAFCAFARGKLTTRILPSFLYTRGYCDAVAKESYLYHPKIRPLEPEIQTLSLTKTLHMGDISSCLQGTFIDPVKREAMMSKFKQNIIQTRLFNFEGDVATRDMSAMPLMQNMLRVVWSYANRYVRNISLFRKENLFGGKREKP